jgi:uncharacterized protein (DUF433 family)
MDTPEQYLDVVAPDEIRVKGHRIGIEHVLLPHVRHGLGAGELARGLPTLSATEIGAVLAYYHEHRAEADAYLRAVREREERAFAEAERNPPPGVRRLLALRTRRGADGTVPTQRPGRW